MATISATVVETGTTQADDVRVLAFDGIGNNDETAVFETVGYSEIVAYTANAGTGDAYSSSGVATFGWQAADDKASPTDFTPVPASTGYSARLQIGTSAADSQMGFIRGAIPRYMRIGYISGGTGINKKVIVEMRKHKTHGVVHGHG